MLRTAWICVVVTACGSPSGTPADAALDASPDAAPTVDAPAPCGDAPAVTAQVDCSGTACAALSIANDMPAPVPAGTFHGYADPTIAHDPAVAGRMWLAYSWPHLRAGQAMDGTAVTMAAVTTHLARSTDSGATFTELGELWPAPAAADPEGSGEQGIMSSETSSLATITSGGTTTWYGAHLHYFLRPINGYNPKYSTGWTVRVTAASSPAELATSPETVLGVSTTAAVYQAIHLDTLAGIPIQHCAILNNPTLFSQAGTLYLIVECLAFAGTTLDDANSTTQVFSTTPSGAPATWTWHHAGVLADHSLAAELGSATIQQPDVSLAADGTPLLVITPAHDDNTMQVGTTGDGCVAIELASIDPPMIKRDCAGHAVIRAKVNGAGIGACTHDAASVSGIIPVTQGATGGDWMIHASGVRP